MRSSGSPPGSVAFRDRADAGRQLAAVLATTLLGPGPPVVLGLPRGGVLVAAEVARELDAPLDVVLVRKLGVPGHPELAVGAIGEGGVRVVNEEVRRAAGMSAGDLAIAEARERAELERQSRLYRRTLPAATRRGQVVVVVDDGIATGASATAACQVVRAEGAARVVLAAPVLGAGSLPALRSVSDEVTFVRATGSFYAIGQWYEDFTQTTDEQVVALLRRAARRRVDPVATSREPPIE